MHKGRMDIVKDVYLHIRIDEETKKEMQEEAAKLGLTLSAYIIYLFKKSRLDK